MDSRKKNKFIQIQAVTSKRDIHSARRLFIEYAETLGFDLGFQNFDKELASLPGDYAPPHGRLYLARVNGKLAGCVALHESSKGICEMKRLYVRPKYRGFGLGRLLAEKVISDSITTGYAAMRLDTIDTMVEAIQLYESMGFTRIEPYRPNPISGAVFMEVRLA